MAGAALFSDGGSERSRARQRRAFCASDPPLVAAIKRGRDSARDWLETAPRAQLAQMGACAGRCALPRALGPICARR
jgi:hypothetical protein